MFEVVINYKTMKIIGLFGLIAAVEAIFINN